jgi:hypothetical protein
MRFTAAIAAFLVALAAFVFSPLLSAQFFGDDWHFFALFRHGDSIVDAFTSNYTGTYIYRPVALLLSWIAFKLVDLHAASHYALNIALHGWVCFSLYYVLRRVAVSRELATFAAFTFALSPITAPTVAWIANRFELLTTAAALSAIALLAAPARTAVHIVGAALLLFLAVGSKETGVAGVAACCVLVVFGRETWRKRIALVLAIASIVLIYGLARAYALGALQPSTYIELSVAVFAQSIVLQVVTLVRAFAAQGVAHVLFLLFIGAALAIPLMQKKQFKYASEMSSKVIAVSISLATLCFLSMLAQAPIAKIMFETGNTGGANLRFFYTPLAALVGIVTLVISHFLARARATSMATPNKTWKNNLTALLACAGLIAFAPTSYRYLSDWQRMTERSNKEVLLAKTMFTSVAAAAEDGDGVCHRAFERLGSPSEREPFLDAAVKAMLERKHASVNCILLTEPPQAFSITRISPCADDRFRPVVSAERDAKPLLRSGTCSLISPRLP